MNSPVKIAVTGIAGRMGQSIATEVLSRNSDAALSAGFARKGSVYIGRDIGDVLRIDKLGISVVPDCNNGFNADVLIDFSHPSALAMHLDWCLKHKAALVLGTTGLTDDDLQTLREAAQHIPILHSGNMSIGIAVMQNTVQEMAKVLGPEYDIEIVETHHKHKVDAPSGTALMLAESAAAGRGVTLKEKAVFERYGQTGERKKGDIGLQTLRGGEIIGDHTVMFLGPSERLEISHKAINRNLFSKGAVDAACWLSQKQAGLYSLQDMLKS